MRNNINTNYRAERLFFISEKNLHQDLKYAQSFSLQMIYHSASKKMYL
jgi:hypothetical protein